MALVPVFPILARAFFSFLWLTRTSGSHVALFARAFVLLPLRLTILGLICLGLAPGPPLLRLRSGAFLRLRLAMLSLAFLGLLRLILRMASFALALTLLRLSRPILRFSFVFLR